MLRERQALPEEKNKSKQIKKPQPNKTTTTTKYKTFDFLSKILSSSFVQRVIAQLKMPRGTEEGSHTLLTHRCTEYACAVGRLRWQDSRKALPQTTALSTVTASLTLDSAE